MPQKVLLIYTELGFVGSYIVHAPISLVYVASKLVNIPDIEVELLDCRVQEDWREILRDRLTNEDVLTVGFFVMSGMQVAKAHEVTEVVKGFDPDVPVVWGGPHPTILADDVLNYGGVDFCVRGFGIEAFTDLVTKLKDGATNYETIPNLCYKKDGENIIGEVNSSYERVSHKDLPYDLLDPFIEDIFGTSEERTFPIYTSFGCPYQCNFCISPIWFKDTNKKWDPLPAMEVVDHIQYLMERFGVTFFYFWDDDTFVSPRHFSGIAEEIIKRDLKIKLGVRGIRSNEVDRMDDKDINLLKRVGVQFVHIGAESGSQRMLDLTQKGITVEQSLSANRKLARHKDIFPLYNMLIGIPTETIEDLMETGRFMLQLSDDNPRAIVHPPNKLIPYPGGESYEMAVKHGFKRPLRPVDWLEVDQESEVNMPWYTPEYNKYTHMLQVAAYGLSNFDAFLRNHSLFIRMTYKICRSIYRPIARYRINNGSVGMLVEYPMMKMGKNILEKMAPANSMD